MALYHGCYKCCSPSRTSSPPHTPGNESRKVDETDRDRRQTKQNTPLAGIAKIGGALSKAKFSLLRRYEVRFPKRDASEPSTMTRRGTVRVASSSRLVRSRSWLNPSQKLVLGQGPVLERPVLPSLRPHGPCFSHRGGEDDSGLISTCDRASSEIPHLFSFSFLTIFWRLRRNR